MAGDWVRIRLGDVCTKIGSGATPRGGSEVYVDEGPFALIRSQNVYNDGFHHEGLAHIGERHAAELANVEVLAGDVLLNITGDSVARVCQVDRRVLPARVNQHVAIIRPDGRRLDPRFLKYALVSLDMQAMLLSWAGAGATRNALTKGMIESLDLTAPGDVGEQRAIAHILGTLDDKIELNRRMSETIEAMARALFKSWFVDFDPVHAKAEHRDTGLPKGVADLFPASFERSELGDIPKGWTTPLVQDVAERVAMGPFGSSIRVSTFLPQGVPVISGQHLHGTMLDDSDFNFISEEHAEQLGRANVQRDDVIFTHAGSIGQVAFIPETALHERYVISQRQFYLRCAADKMSPLFIVCYFKTPEGQHRLLANTSSTGVPSISRPVTYLRQLRIVAPPRQLLLAFDRMARSVFRLAAHNSKQSKTLALLRDTLLPKLISGELRVKDAERFVAAAT